MIVPSFRLYHFAVKLIWKRMLALTLLFWLGVAGVYYMVNEMPVWQEYGWWLMLMVGGTYFLFMDVKLMLLMIRHEEKKKWKRYRLKNKFECFTSLFWVCMGIRKHCFISLFLFIVQTVTAQINYGTTGLMNLPTADMQRDKTFMAGGNWLNHHATVPRWWYDTWNYYINITIFPWLEAGYLCTGHKAVPTDYGNNSGYWVPSTYGKFTNQDRSFHFRLRVWKEGWWKPWTPQVVIGANDAIGDSANGGSLSNQQNQDYGNGFWNRYYLAITKHVNFDNIGTLGAHISWIYSNRFDNKLNNPAMGVNFCFHLKEDDSWIRKAVNGVNLMAEVVPGYTDVKEDLTFNPNGPKYQMNVGMEYSFWKDYINAVIELNRCKYFSGGIYFKIHLK